MARHLRPGNEPLTDRPDTLAGLFYVKMQVLGMMNKKRTHKAANKAQPKRALGNAGPRAVGRDENASARGGIMEATIYRVEMRDDSEGTSRHPVLQGSTALTLEGTLKTLL